MKIIKNGTKKEAVMRVVCEKCNAKLEISAEDVKKTKGGCGGMLEGSTQTLRFYKCPCCAERNYLDYGKLLRAFGFSTKF